MQIHKVVALTGNKLKEDCCGDRYPCNKEYACSCGVEKCSSCMKGHLFQLHRLGDVDRWQAAYYDAIMKCVERYKPMAVPDQDLLKFLDEFNREVPLMKLSRWLGYVQGVLIDKRITTVEAERDWTRPLFRPLDFG